MLNTVDTIIIQKRLKLKWRTTVVKNFMNIGDLAGFLLGLHKYHWCHCQRERYSLCLYTWYMQIVLQYNKSVKSRTFDVECEGKGHLLVDWKSIALYHCGLQDTSQKYTAKFSRFVAIAKWGEIRTRWSWKWWSRLKFMDDLTDVWPLSRSDLWSI